MPQPVGYPKNVNLSGVFRGVPGPSKVISSRSNGHFFLLRIWYISTGTSPTSKFLNTPLPITADNISGGNVVKKKKKKYVE